MGYDDIVQTVLNVGKSLMVGSDQYLKTQQVADALGVSVSTIKRWVDAHLIDATITPGKHRLISLASALEFARRERYPVEPLLALATPMAATASIESQSDLLFDLLRLGKASEAKGLMKSAFLTSGAVGLADQLIRPVMERVGQGWMVGSIDIYQEHQATQIVAATVNELIAASASTTTQGRPVALGASPEGDIYMLPGLLGELSLREVGWDVRNLGPNLPLRSLAQATRSYRPGLIFISVSQITDQALFLQEYSYFYEAATRVGAAVILGGRALAPELRSRLVYASFGDRIAHLAEFARRILPATLVPDASPATSHHSTSMNLPN